MAPIYWIVVLAGIGVLGWFANRLNGSSQHMQRTKELERENRHLRHVVAQLTMERHTPAEYG